MKYSRDIFYTTALILVVVAGCQTPLGRFNKKEAVDDEVILKNHFTQKELLETIEPAIKRALSTGRIKNTSKFKKELFIF